jgi:hypothetical protein
MDPLVNDNRLSPEVPLITSVLKASDPWDLPVAGLVLRPRAHQTRDSLRDLEIVRAEMAGRDGVYVYLISIYEHHEQIVISHRLPSNVSSGNQEFLATHRSLAQRLREELGTKHLSIIAAGEIRVVGGHAVIINLKSGTYHDDLLHIINDLRVRGESLDPREVQLAFNEIQRRIVSGEDIESIARSTSFYDSIPALGKAILGEYDRRSRIRMDFAWERLYELGLVERDTVERIGLFDAGDHTKNRAAAIFEMRCLQSRACLLDLARLTAFVKRLVNTYGYLGAIAEIEQRRERIIAEGVVSAELVNQVWHWRNLLDSVKDGPVDLLQRLYNTSENRSSTAAHFLNRKANKLELVETRDADESSRIEGENRSRFYLEGLLEIIQKWQ